MTRYGLLSWCAQIIAPLPFARVCRVRVRRDAEDAVLHYALAADAALAALCDVAVSGTDFILAIPHAGFAARLPTLLAGGSDSGEVPLLAARAFA